MYPIRYPGRRPVIRGTILNPTNSGITGTVNINVSFIKPEFYIIGTGSSARPSFRPLVNGAKYAPGIATSASPTTAYNPSILKNTQTSIYVDSANMTGDTWYPYQLCSQPDSNVPHWCTHVLVEVDMTSSGIGQLNFDRPDVQWL